MLTCIGRNIGAPRLLFDGKLAADDKLVELWPGVGIDLRKNSLAYSVLVANSAIRFVFLEDFPRNVLDFTFRHFKVLFLYWLFNRPTKFRGTTLTFSTSGKYTDGFEFHEVLNFTNDMTLMHCDVYQTLPEVPPAPPQ